ncbi:MAG TPA: helicase-related protein [Burkholderiales bacterium]|nr:helicase-related protein [Burkholderiales bacterium]
MGVFFANVMGVPDNMVQGITAPQKWLRLELALPSFTFSCSDYRKAASDATTALREAVAKQLIVWRDSNDVSSGGAMWGFRRTRNIKPSDVRDWDRYLSEVRQSSLAPVLPALDPRWVVEINDDATDRTRRNIHVALENWSDEPSRQQFKHTEEALFQIAFAVSMPANIHRSLQLDRVQPSYRYNEYLNYPALGFNGGVIAQVHADSITLATTWWPRYTQPRIIPTELANKRVVANIAALSKDDCLVGLRPLVSAYEDWLDGVKKHPYDKGIDPSRSDLIEREKQKLQKDIDAWSRELDAIRLGITILTESREHWAGPGAQKDPRGVPFEAWVSMNDAMARVASKKGYGDWRLFQLAFILANLPAFVTRVPEFHHHYTAEVAEYSSGVTLLYFATGGGKSEAFLGLLVFVLFLDRLRGKERGVSAMLRYPLRLLTLQQAQRTGKTLAQAELVRRQRNHPGEAFSLGFWVGSANTPNWLGDEDLRDSVPMLSVAPASVEQDLLDQPAYKLAVERWRKVPECPFCANKAGTALRRFDQRAGLLGHLCLNQECAWNKAHPNPTALPVYIVDEDIYDLAPSVLLGTVDKLSAIGQSQGTIRKFFGMFGFAPWWEPATDRLHVPLAKDWKSGLGTKYVPLFPTYATGAKRFFDPFPSLLIQDEAHLLDESLGTFSGLFETALDAVLDELAPLLGSVLVREPGAQVRRRIKVVAASATVNEPDRQMKSLYQRDSVVQFPYPGPELYRSFYAEPKQPDNSSEDTERHTIALDLVEVRNHWARVYQSILTNGRNHTATMVVTLATYHAVITNLYERLRSGDAVQQTAAREQLVAHLSEGLLHVQHERLLREATPERLATLLDLHRIGLTYVTNKKGGDQIIDAERTEFEKLHQKDGFPAHALNSDLITGAVDAGQIQRVVRRAETRPQPGEAFLELNDTLRSIIATSAVSHGVDVEELNAMFFAGMPSDISEYIQASSRVGRTHVGFCVLIPTPQRARDRYIVEVHDIFHRFLERMILPAAIDRWAEKALVRAIPSFFQAFVCGVNAIRQLASADDADKPNQVDFRRVSDVRDAINGDPATQKKAICKFVRQAFGLKPGFMPQGEEYYQRVVTKQVDSIHNSLEEPRFLGTDLKYFFAVRDIRLRPMTSLRDVDEPGYLVPFGREANDQARVPEGALERTMRFIRRGAGADVDDSSTADNREE